MPTTTTEARPSSKPGTKMRNVRVGDTLWDEAGAEAKADRDADGRPLDRAVIMRAALVDYLAHRRAGTVPAWLDRNA